MNFGAHELLETQEALRTKAAHIELYGVLLDMAQDPQLRGVLENQHRRMIQGYQQGVSLLQGRGVSAGMPQLSQMNTRQQPNIGLHNPTMTPPNPNSTRLSDMTISTVVLNMHKSGSAISMLWASECVDPQIRSYHTALANECQQMAYEVWQYMNAKGYYQVAQFGQQTMNTMMQAFPNQSAGQPYRQPGMQ